jgi:hypothetical protein
VRSSNSRRRSRSALALAAFAWSALSCASTTACPFETVAPPPGTQIGYFAMHAEPALAPGGGPLVYEDGGLQCVLTDVFLAAFDFDMALSSEVIDGGEVGYMTLSPNYPRSATWDGQVMRSTADARRYFEECNECVTRVEETIDVALLSRSQSDAVGNSCPANPLDGGVPQPNDAGIIPPGPRDQGFDALLACGELHTQVLVDEGLPDGGPCPEKCGACRTTYVLSGERR